METEKGIFLPGTNGEENGFDATSTNKRPVGKTRANNRSHRNSFSQLIHIYIGPGLHGGFKAANRSVEPQQTEMNRLCGCNVVLQFGLGSLYHEFLMAICTAFQIPLLTYTVWLRCVCGGGGGYRHGAPKLYIARSKREWVRLDSGAACVWNGSEQSDHNEPTEPE